MAEIFFCIFFLIVSLVKTNVYAGIFGPSTGVHSGLSAVSANGPSELISKNKVVVDKLVKVNCYGNPCEPDGPGLAKAVDGDPKTATGPITFLSIDLGDVYVIDSSVINFAHAEKYNVATSLYWNGTFPAADNLTAGYGSFPDSGITHQDFYPILWKELDHQKGLIDGWRINPTVGRFLHYYFRQESAYEVANINEVEVYGHKYIPHAGDMVSLNRSKWTATGSSCKNCGEGWTGEAMFDWLMGPHEMDATPGDWVTIDFGESVKFSQIAMVLGSTAKLNVFTTSDTTHWGNVLTSFSAAGVDTVTLTVPEQNVRYLKIVNPGEATGAWWYIFDLTLWTPLDPKNVGIKKQIRESVHRNSSSWASRWFNLKGQLFETRK